MPNNATRSPSLLYISRNYVRNQVKKIESAEDKEFKSKYTEALDSFFSTYFSKDATKLLTKNLVKLIKSPREFKDSLHLSNPNSAEICREIEKKLLVEGDEKCQIIIFSKLNAKNLEKFFKDNASQHIHRDEFLKYCTKKIVDFHKKNPSAKIFKLNERNIKILSQEFQRIQVARVYKHIPYTSSFNSGVKALGTTIPSAIIATGILVGDKLQRANPAAIVAERLTDYKPKSPRKPTLSSKSIRRYF